ncbi:helix-turn-helix transcriptional regulator [Paenibacillus oryzisoli]|uniref:PAS sensor protein n=1 Tax=Paenibacillus oryzisoli TaxID=1850517 RepID=A0A198AAM2_9BACL|nr:AAA family ATPase [Paenibacillus oryzisoli]OAS17998.1 PAS sensor protein [Paenibacillus oryzisoli]
MEVKHPIEKRIGNSQLNVSPLNTPLMHEEDITLRTYMNGQMGIKPEAFLPIAKSIVNCVGKLHHRQIIHLDLRPERIGIHADGKAAYLLDSGHEVHRSAYGYATTLGSCTYESGLPYCSPEQTGSMHRNVDERSDLYAIGVIFFEMLAHQLPFQTDNHLEWVYFHLAQSPPPLPNLHEHLPDGLESIVRKLLAKNPDKRYQSASLLLADLDKIGRSHDTLFMEQGYHGRENEISILTQAFYSACLGSTEMIYVSGEAGIGKTSLINEVLRKQQLDRDFFYITGKFEQLSNESPYHPIIQAFRGLIRHLLGQRKEQTERWKHRLQEALGSNINIITTIIPEAELLLGSGTPAVEELQAHESKKRFIFVFRKFVQALTSKEHPLILFIDDLQWANASSLQLIHALLSDPESQYVMIICAYRHSETDRYILPGYEADGNITMQAVVRHIHLQQLSLEQMNRVVMETLNSSADSTWSLTELLYHQSNGNPFHFKQILLRLQDDRTLYYNHEKRCWQWDLGQILEQEPRYSIQDLMEHKLHRLTNDAQELLQIAACVGSTFHPKLIARFANPVIEHSHSIWSAIESEGMIVPFEEDTYRFAHDNIQKLIYNRMDDIWKQDVHLRIGRSLIRNEDGYVDNAFDAVNHLNRGSKRITDEQEILQLVKLNLNAGNRAKSSTDYDVALGYFRKGVGLLSAKDWESEFELLFELHAQKAECEYLCGNSSDSDREIHFLLDRARCPLERSRVQIIRIMQYINQGRYLESTTLGLESLKEHDIYISPNPSKFMLLLEGLRIESMLGKQYERLAHLEDMSDKTGIGAMNLIFAMIPSTFFTNKEVFFLLMCRAIQLSLKFGNTPVSAAVYSAIGMLLGISLGKFDKGYAIAKVGVDLSERYNVTSIKSNTYTMFGSVLCQFAGNAREGNAYLIKALRCGLDSGNFVFASYAMGGHVNSLYTRASLSELARTIADYMAVLDTTKDEFVRQNFYLYQQVILALQSKTSAQNSFNGPGFDEDEFLNRIHKEETSATTLFQFSTYKTQLCYFLGNYEEAIRWADQAKSYTAYATHLPHLPECLFYETLALFAAEPRSHKHVKRWGNNVRRFRKWAAWSSINYHSRYTLLQAEYARVSGDYDKAEEMYDKAIREAREQDDVHVTSIASEIAAGHYLRGEKRKTALHYLQLAIEGYQQWEVHMKVRQLEELILIVQQEKDTFETPSNAVNFIDQTTSTEPAAGTLGTRNHLHTKESVDLAAILKTTQAINNKIDMDTVLGEIMNTIMKHAGASKGALLTGSEEKLYIQTYAHSDTPAFTTPFEMHDSTLFPEGIIRYVFRTKEMVNYAGEAESWLIHNPYIIKQQPQSVLCIPVTVHGTMLGILYLENKLVNVALSPDTIAVLQAIASHGIFMCVLQSLPSPSNSELVTEEEIEQSPNSIEEPLTDRELEVLALLSAGMSNKEIADQLIIAVGTVKVHVKNIFVKLKVNRRIKAIAQAKELKLIGEHSRHSLK